MAENLSRRPRQPSRHHQRPGHHQPAGGRHLRPRCVGPGRLPVRHGDARHRRPVPRLLLGSRGRRQDRRGYEPDPPRAASPRTGIRSPLHQLPSLARRGDGQHRDDGGFRRPARRVVLAPLLPRKRFLAAALGRGVPARTSLTYEIAAGDISANFVFVNELGISIKEIPQVIGEQVSFGLNVAVPAGVAAALNDAKLQVSYRTNLVKRS